MWKVEVDSTHHVQYYNMCLRKYCWINGDNHPRNKPVTNGTEPPLQESTTEEDEGVVGISGV